MRTAVVMLAAIAAFLASCSSASRTRVEPGSTNIHTSEAPPESNFKRQLVQLPDGTVIESEQTGKSGGSSVTNAMARGAGVDTTSDEIGAEFRGTAPSVTLPDGSGASGGDADSNIMAKGFNLARLAPLYIVGGVLALAGVLIAVMLRQIAIGVAVGGAGVLVMLMAAYPMLAVIALVLAAVGGGFWLFRNQKAKDAINESIATAVNEAGRYREALRGVVAGVASAPEEAKKAVKAEIAKQTEPADDLTIEEIKKADGL